LIQKQKKPFTAVTVQIDRLTSEQYDENDLGGIVDLIEVIRIQDTGPTEAARAIRKKLCVCPFLHFF
jgi:LAS seventeen-binding protein 5